MEWLGGGHHRRRQAGTQGVVGAGEECLGEVVGDCQQETQVIALKIFGTRR